MSAPLRSPIAHVLERAAATGAIAGFAAGALDALWSWSAAAQFVPDTTARIRFVLFGAFTHAAAGVLVGLVVAAIALVLARGTRLGDLVRLAWREHAARRAKDPRSALAGLSLVLGILPAIGFALLVAYRQALPYVTNRKEWSLIVLVVMGATLAAIVVGVLLGFVVARGIEDLLARLGKHERVARVLAWPWSPLVVAGALAAAAIIAWVVIRWETARVLKLRAPLVLAIGALLALGARYPARRFVEIVNVFRPAIRRTVLVVAPILLLVVVLSAGGSAAVVKASSSYTGAGGTIVRVLRKTFDRDRDGFARYLGGGDCDDTDRTVHPGAPEIPDDGIDQNCVGGDASARAAQLDTAFAPVPPTVPADFRILFITIDTIRADHLGAYGYARPTSPRIDELAKQGTVFEHGWAHAPSTRYSIPAILTGRLPLDVHYNTAIDGWPGLAEKATTLAEALAPLGFYGGAITNYWYFDRVRRMDQGMAPEAYDNENAKLHQGVSGAGPEQTKGSSSQQQTDKALAFVDKHADKRWFLWVHYYDPHYAYEPHADVPTLGNDRVGLYDGEIRFTDHHIGRLLDGLRARGVYDKTVVVITGDHGEGFGEHGIELHGYHLYAAQTKVPVIVRVPGLPPRRSTTPAGHVDLLPTLVNLAGGKPSPDMMGRSLVGPLTGTDTDRVVFQQLSYEGNHEMRGGASRACHVVYNVSPDTSWEVYRTDQDPGETRDVAGTDDTCTETRRAVERWYDLEQVPAGAAEALLSERPAVARPLDADLGESVRLLGADIPSTVKAGGTIDITWTFEARGHVAAGWKLFVHVDGPNRGFINGDHVPARPFEWWRVGQFIRYKTTLAVPARSPRGTYTVRIGMFKGTTRAKVKAAPAVKIVNDSVVAGSFEVVP